MGLSSCTDHLQLGWLQGFTGVAAQPQHEKYRSTILYETTWTLQWMPTEHIEIIAENQEKPIQCFRSSYNMEYLAPFNDIEKNQCSKHAEKCDEQKNNNSQKHELQQDNTPRRLVWNLKTMVLEGDFSFSRGVFSGSHFVLPNPWSPDGITMFHLVGLKWKNHIT